MYEIEEALKRIEKNTYGVCELTGKPIPKTRLEAIPWARFTGSGPGPIGTGGRSAPTQPRRVGKRGCRRR